MKVFKFGGASIKNAEGVINLHKIIDYNVSDRIVVVVSAMGKTTNALETLLAKAISEQDFSENLDDLKSMHLSICHSLFEKQHPIFSFLKDSFNHLYEQLQQVQKSEYDFHYDQIVSQGEIISTRIIEAFLREQDCKSAWLDARQLIRTDSSFRSAKVSLAETEKNIMNLLQTDARILLTQGFIGANEKGQTTTLGREGSDYSAALFAYALKTEEVIIWKDVDGVYNADPKIFQSPQLIEYLSYKDAVELAFYGASIIHPKTIQPLSERNIVLKVKSFYKPNLAGTRVAQEEKKETGPASVIVKKNQLLLSLVPRDLSFTDLPNMSKALKIIAEHRHQVNLIQNSAVSFSVCLDSNIYHFNELLEELNDYFMVRYNTGLILVTIRNYPPKLVDKIYENVYFKLEQRNRSTFQVLLDEEEFESRLHGIIDF